MDHPALYSPQTNNHFSSIFVVIITLKVLAHSIGCTGYLKNNTLINGYTKNDTKTIVEKIYV